MITFSRLITQQLILIIKNKIDKSLKKFDYLHEKFLFINDNARSFFSI